MTLTVAAGCAVFLVLISIGLRNRTCTELRSRRDVIIELFDQEQLLRRSLSLQRAAPVMAPAETIHL